MHNLIWDNGFEEKTIIGHHDQKIKRILISQLKENDCFLDTTWITVRDAGFRDFLQKCKQESRRIICYSGPDWNNLYGPPCEPHSFQQEWQLLNQCDILHIGNSLGPHYFSFWVDFVHDNISGFEKFDPYNLKFPLKHFMCLNRKPHRPRINLYNELFLKGYLEYGHASLGERTQLPLDIKNEEGDASVVGDVGITNDITTLGHPDNWNSHYLNIVTETTVYTDVFITEKTFKPILGRRPFVILGDNNIYKLLKDWGFDTFDDLFGTGYNRIDYNDRIQWIQSVVGEVITLNQEQLHRSLLDLKPRLDYNYNLFFKIAKENKEKLYHLLDK